MLGSVNMVLYIWAVPRFEMRNKTGMIIILRERERDRKMATT